MIKIFDWVLQNWKGVVFFLTIGFLFTMIKPITDWLRGIKESMREIFTPLGFLVFIVLIGFAIFIVFPGKVGCFQYDYPG